MFGDFTRTWKWAVPLILCAIFLWLSIVLLPLGWKNTALLTMMFCGVNALIALTNWWRLKRDLDEELFERHQHALSMTPLVLLSENMKSMHPEAVRVLNRFGVRTSWQVKVDANHGQRDWVLMDTNVHFGFIEFVLSRSGKALYPKNRFGEGSHKWDPDGLVDDREQYAEFENWMFARLMVTRSHGDFKPAEFIPPWTPALIRETLGLTGEQDLYQPDEEKMVKELAPLSPGTATSPQMPANGGGNLGGKKEVRELNDEELASIEAENERYASMYADGKIPS